MPLLGRSRDEKRKIANTGRNTAGRFFRPLVRKSRHLGSRVGLLRRRFKSSLKISWDNEGKATRAGWRESQRREPVSASKGGQDQPGYRASLNIGRILYYVGRRRERAQDTQTRCIGNHDDESPQPPRPSRDLSLYSPSSLTLFLLSLNDLFFLLIYLSNHNHFNKIFLSNIFLILLKFILNYIK